MSSILAGILQNLKPYKFDKEKNFFVSDLARNLNPGTLKRFPPNKFSENFFGPSENFFFRSGKIESKSANFQISKIWIKFGQNFGNPRWAVLSKVTACTAPNKKFFRVPETISCRLNPIWSCYGHGRKNDIWRKLEK